MTSAFTPAAGSTTGARRTTLLVDDAHDYAVGHVCSPLKLTHTADFQARAVLGATIVSAHAGEQIGAVTLARTNGLGLAAFGRTMHPYPTQGEVRRKAADVWRRRKLTPRAKGLFARYFRLIG